jgi:hypothetical protein
MVRRCKILISCAAALCVCAAAVSARGDAALGDALAAFDAATRSVESYDVACTFKMEALLGTNVTGTKTVHGRSIPTLEMREWEPGEAHTTIVRYHRQVMGSGGERRIEWSDSAGGPLSVEAVSRGNGNGSMRYSPPSHLASITSHLTASADDGWNYSAYFLDAFGEYPYTKLFRGRASTRVVRTNPVPHTLEIESPPEGRYWDAFGWRVWLDLDHGSMPSRVERYLRTPDVLFDRTEITQFRQLQSGVWVPVAGRDTFYETAKDKPFYGVPSRSISMDVNVGKSHWNEPIPASRFDLPIPAGTHVTDLPRHIVYTTGSADSGKNLSELVQHATELPRSRGTGLTAPPPPDGARFWYVGLLVLNVGVVLALAMLIAWRRARAAR